MLGLLDRLDDGAEQPLAGTEVVVEHPVARADARREGAQARVADPVLGEPADRAAEQLVAGGRRARGAGLPGAWRRQAPASSVASAAHRAGRAVERLGLAGDVVPAFRPTRAGAAAPAAPTRRCRARSSSAVRPRAQHVRAHRADAGLRRLPREGAARLDRGDRPDGARQAGLLDGVRGPDLVGSGGVERGDGVDGGEPLRPVPHVGHHLPQPVGGGAGLSDHLGHVPNGTPAKATGRQGPAPRLVAPADRAARGGAAPAPVTLARHPPPRHPPGDRTHGLVARPRADHRPGRQRPLPVPRRGAAGPAAARRARASPPSRRATCTGSRARAASTRRPGDRRAAAHLRHAVCR